MGSLRNDAVIPTPSDSGDVTASLPGAQDLHSLAALAERLHGDPAALLDLLRRLEQLHRAIQDGPFRDSLPSDRNRLYQLLEGMEYSGGWPYIPRLQLRTFIELLKREEREGSPPSCATDEPPLAA
ncbi:MAG: hypothetical protein ACKOZT_03625 [Cyanobium sp.]